MRFKVKKEETEVEAATGDVVTFEYENFSRRDVPVNPRVTRVRKDLTWEYIINSILSSLSCFLLVSYAVIYSATSSKGFTTKPMNFWDDEKNVRKFFEQFALKRQLNPLDPSTWYSTSRASIETAKVTSCTFFAASFCFVLFIYLFILMVLAGRVSPMRG